MSLVVLIALSGFVVSPCPTSTVVTYRTAYATSRSAHGSPHMGFFEDFKKGFENDQRLEKDRNINAGKSKNPPGYAKKKVQDRARYEAQGSSKSDQGQGDRTFDELFSGWKW